MRVKWSPAAILIVALVLVPVLISHFVFGKVARVRYDGFQMWRAKPKSQDQADAIYSLQQYGVELWREPVLSGPDPSADIFIAPAAVPAISATLSDAEVEYDVLIEDMQPLIDAEAEKAVTRDSRFSFTSWQQWDSIVDFMRELADESKGRIQLIELQKKSVEDLPLLVLKIRSEDSYNKPETKPVVFIEGGMHAREWISPAVALYIANELANNIQGPQGEVNRKLLEKYDFHIYPVANPDGYKYTQVNRLWRKSRTRGPTLLNWCPGVDLNRNFDIKWNETVGASTFPCATDYKGPAPLSEPETKALAEYWSSLGNRFQVYFSLHSYGQIWAYPFGYKRDDPADHLVFSEVVSQGTQKLKERYGSKYTIGSAAQLLYIVSGSAMDYVYDVLKVKHSYLIELRPDIGDQQGFLLHPDLILPTSVETWDGMREALDYIHKDLFGYKATDEVYPNALKPKENNLVEGEKSKEEKENEVVADETEEKTNKDGTPVVESIPVERLAPESPEEKIVESSVAETQEQTKVLENSELVKEETKPVKEESLVSSDRVEPLLKSNKEPEKPKEEAEANVANDDSEPEVGNPVSNDNPEPEVSEAKAEVPVEPQPADSPAESEVINDSAKPEEVGNPDKQKEPSDHAGIPEHLLL